MRAFIILGTLMCIAACTASVTQEEVDAIWKEAAECYKQQLLNQTMQGATTRAKRSLKSTPESEVMSDNSNIFAIYETMIMEKHNITKRQAAGTQTPAACQIPRFNCNGAANARYRNVDGTCNNLNQPLWGSRNRPLNRIARPAYEDGSNVPRGGFNSYLPSARAVSNSVYFDNNPLNRQVTNMIPQFGQFLDHDMSMTPEASSQCCSNPRSNVDCWSINIPTNDPFYSRTRPAAQRCMDFTRSTTCSNGGVREQINGITAYIDGSMIYGSDPERTRALRAFQGGRLATNPSLQGFLPSGPSRGIQVSGLFVAGDDRINVTPGLAVLHNVFLMEHNRIAAELARLTRSTNDEFLFQETRRIVIAILQNIVYSEYLPIVLGPNTMREYGLTLPNSGYTPYSANTDATIINSFATAAYRFGHSMIPGIMRLMAGNNRQTGQYNVRDNFFKSETITQSNGQGYDLILRGLFTVNAPEMDRHVTDDLRNNLFKADGATFGADLPARNTQRGRDHGLPAYNVFRQLCGLPSISSNWNSRPANINADGWTALSNAYSTNRNSPLQVDLFAGGLVETPVQGGLTGQTFSCIKGVQFQRLKDGDRYFFTHRTGPYAFSQGQIDEIRKQTLGDVICRNSQQPDAARNVFLIPSGSNAVVACRSRRAMNLGVFLN